MIPPKSHFSFWQEESNIDSVGSGDGKFAPVRQTLPDWGENKPLQHLNLVNQGEVAARIAARRGGRGQERFMGHQQERNVGG